MRLYERPYLLLTLTTLMWAGNAIASRLAVGHVSPMMVTTLRWVGTLTILLIIARSALVADWPAIKARWRWFVVMGVLGFTGFNALFYISAQYTTAINLGIIQGSIPIMVLIGAFLAYRTTISPLQIGGITTTLVGIALLATQGHLERLFGFVFNIGDVIMLAACLGYSTYTVALRNRPAVSPLAFFTMLSSVALVSSLPLLAVEASLGQTQAPDLRGWLLVAYIATGPGLLSQLFFIRAVELIGPGRAGVFVNLVPVWSAIMGPLILGEIFGWYHAAALALVLGGIWLAERWKPSG